MQNNYNCCSATRAGASCYSMVHSRAGRMIIIFYFLVRSCVPFLAIRVLSISNLNQVQVCQTVDPR
jgi:hypothetical protein